MLVHVGSEPRWRPGIPQIHKLRLIHVLSELFEKLRATNPGALKKITALEGDITLPDLGLSEENRRLLAEEVDIVFHCAASLRLEAEIKLAVEHNTLATLRLLQLCREMKNLQALIHLSTAFCHCDQYELEEKVYPSPADPHDVIKLVQWLDDDTLRIITPRLLGPHPNCYTYSKRLAETLVAQEKDHMPVAIIRPSAGEYVTPPWREMVLQSPSLGSLTLDDDPLPGWVDTLNGPIGVLVGAGKGVIRSMMCNPNYQAEMIPVDLAINAMIAVAHKTATHKEEEIPVYNLTSSTYVHITWGEMIEKGKKCVYDYPFEGAAWYPDGNARTNKILHNLCIIFMLILPSYLIDFLLTLARQKRFMVRLQKRIRVGLGVLEHFTTTKWKFKMSRVINMSESMRDTDKELFYITNVKQDIDKYMLDCILGARQYLMKEPLSSLPSARIHMKRLYYLDLVMTVLLYCLFGWLLLQGIYTVRFCLEYSSHGLRGIPLLRGIAPSFS
uniref:Fatty acyl-CoA reductase n=1 Tax=Timema monikensis TaxID=170555 RepID=A0A7R9HQU3_9NEOP|nr:unnamed protein product [Timema monikensis]